MKNLSTNQDMQFNADKLINTISASTAINKKICEWDLTASDIHR